MGHVPLAIFYAMAYLKSPHPRDPDQVKQLIQAVLSDKNA